MTTTVRDQLQSRRRQEERRRYSATHTYPSARLLQDTPEGASGRLLASAGSALGVRSRYAGFWTTYQFNSIAHFARFIIWSGPEP
jgi:hypothetical protein